MNEYIKCYENRYVKLGECIFKDDAIQPSWGIGEVKITSNIYVPTYIKKDNNYIKVSEALYNSINFTIKSRKQIWKAIAIQYPEKFI